MQNKELQTMAALSPSNGAHYTHTDLSHITMESWEIPVLFTDRWCNNFTDDIIALFLGIIISPRLRAGDMKNGYDKGLWCKRHLEGENKDD